MNQPLRFLTVGGLLTILWACMEIRPLSAPSNLLAPIVSIQPPIFTPECPNLEKKILGSWKCTTTKLLNTRGGSTNYSGRITLNADKTLLDPDTLLGYKIEDELVTRRIYELTGDSLILFVADRLERQLGIIMRLQAGQCDNPKFIRNGGVGITTTLIR